MGAGNLDGWWERKKGGQGGRQGGDRGGESLRKKRRKAQSSAKNWVWASKRDIRD